MTSNEESTIEVFPFPHPRDRSMKIKRVGVQVASIVVLLEVSVPFVWMGFVPLPGWVILLTVSEYLFAGSAVVLLTGKALRAITGPQGYVCRWCGFGMRERVCAEGHTHELAERS